MEQNKSQDIFAEHPKYEEDMPTKSRTRPNTSPVRYGTRNSYGLTPQRPSTSLYSSRRYKSPYTEPPFTYVLKQGKTLPPPRKTQQLTKTTHFGHIPKGTIQAPVVAVSSRDAPKAVNYRTRTEHWDKYDRTCEISWTEKYSRQQKHSPYKEKLYNIRETSIVETKKALKQRDIESARERRREVDEYQKAMQREKQIEKNYPKGDIIHNKEKSLRIMITD